MGDADVVGDEGLVIPFASDRVEPVEENDQAEEDAGGVAEVGLEGRFHWQGVAVDALSLASVVKADVGDANADPGEQGRDGGQVLEPGENFV